MTATVTQLFDQQQSLAEVSEVSPQGKALSVVINHIRYDVVLQAAHVSCCKIGSQVVVLHSEQGVIVTALLAAPEQSPAAHISNEAGHIIIAAEQSVSLQTAKGSIEVFADGTIVLEGEDITANSQQDLTLAGWPIRLN